MGGDKKGHSTKRQLWLHLNRSPTHGPHPSAGQPNQNDPFLEQFVKIASINQKVVAAFVTNTL